MYDSAKRHKDDSDHWQDKDTVWHDVLVFRPTAVQFAEELKKGDKIELRGSLNISSSRMKTATTAHRLKLLPDLYSTK